ncbi:MAG: hypothetical protein L3J71_05690 [Victivallaceae bacterium]|nr:hypothetical protein [Victivallaceae bacterium]
MDNNEIKKFMAKELNEGTSLSDIQKLLADEHETKITFLDLRILASELENIEWEKPEEPAEEEEAEAEVEQPEATGTVVEVSKLIRPGAVANGSVKFASGATAEWILNQQGQLGLDKAKGEPTEDDIKEFQVELQKVFAQGR